MTDLELKQLLEKYGAVQVPSEIIGLYRAVEKSKPRVIVEVGVEYGGTFKLWSTLLGPGDLLIGVDLKEHYTWNGEGTECNLVYIQGNSQEQETIDKVKEALGDRKVDFVFIDGDHTQAGVTNDYVNYGKLVSRGGTIGFHDINDGTGVKQFWSTIPQPKHEFNEGIGVGFILKESD